MIRNLLVRCSGLVVALVSLAACSGAAPYERGKLAHPTMTTGDLSTPTEDHARAVQEGAAGGSLSVGGGCGCN